MTQVQLETLKLENQHLNDLLERVESRSPKVLILCIVNTRYDHLIIGSIWVKDKSLQFELRFSIY